MNDSIVKAALQDVDAKYAAMGTAVQGLRDALVAVPVPLPTTARTFNDRAWYVVQARDQSRVTWFPDRVSLRTEPGDIVLSDTMERTDIYLADGPGSQAPLVWGDGVEQWWRHATMLPDDFDYPTWQMYVLMDFHNSNGPWQANFHVNFAPQLGEANVDKPGELIFRGFGGAKDMDGPFGARIGQVARNVWHDFVYHMRWSSGPDGYFDAWMNGKRYVSHQGPTLYAGQGVYLKLANYHSPVRGLASSVIHKYPTLADNAADLGVVPLDVNWQAIKVGPLTTPTT